MGDGNTVYGDSIKNLKLDVVYEANDYVRVKITDADNTRWEVPESLVNRPSATTKATAPEYTLEYTETPFSFEVFRKSDAASIFKFSSEFMFKDQYIEFSSLFDADAKTFGIGESTRTHHALNPGSTFTLWARDEPAAVLDTNLYGSFPYYLQLLNGKAHGAMLMNSNGMDVRLSDDALKFSVIGGVVDLYVFTGSSPNEVVRQYTDVVGRPTMQPYWSFGFHNCKYGYTSVYEVEDVVQKYKDAKIPLDTQWMDIDYMEAYRDFTFDPTNFPVEETRKFVEGLHEDGMKFVPIIDPGIMVYADYEAYEEGLEKEVFVKDVSGGYYLGQVWPGPTYFPDFFHPSTQDYWTKQLKSFHDMVPVDGLWIDMNEVSNFCNDNGAGQVCANSRSEGCPAPGASQTDCCLECETVDPSNSLDFPPYNINNVGGLLSVKTMSMSAQHYGNVSVYDAHNLYGISEQIATKSALETIRGKRPFIVTRSSFLGTGAYSAKWTGDNAATWDDLKASIVGIMDFSIFGVPMVGADICGFLGDSWEELCARWIEVGAFYPFSRDHNTLGAKPQELYLWDTVTEASQTYLGMRYQLLPYMYTLFYSAHVSGSMYSRALWVNFPEDANTAGIDEQFMIGDALMISPVIRAGETSVNAYFPAGLWYDMETRTLAVDSSKGGIYKDLSTPLTKTNVHVLGGNVLPLQQSAMTTVEGRKTPFTLLAALDSSGAATGELFWDDGEQISVQEYLEVSYAVQAEGSTGSVTATIKNSDYAEASTLSIEVVEVMGGSSTLAAPSSVIVNGVVVEGAEITFSADKGSIVFSSLAIKLTDAFELTWK